LALVVAVEEQQLEEQPVLILCLQLLLLWAVVELVLRLLVEIQSGLMEVLVVVLVEMQVQQHQQALEHQDKDMPV